MPKTNAPRHFNSYNAYLRMRFGGRVGKLSLGLGIPCAHRRENAPGCVFCRPGVIMRDDIISLGTIENQINAGAMTVGKRYKTDLFLAYFQNETNTDGETTWLLDRYDEALSHPATKGIIISTRPDRISDTMFDLLAARAWRKPVFLELGLQSCHNETLKRINRGHDYECFEEAVLKAHERKLPVCAHAILGLPGETPEMMVETFKTLAKLPLDSVKIHHLQVYKDSPLETEWFRDQVPVFDDFDEYVEVLLDCLEVLPWSIKIQRLVADAPRTYLLAPIWGLTKNEIIKKVEDGFTKRGTRQGSKAGK